MDIKLNQVNETSGSLPFVGSGREHVFNVSDTLDGATVELSFAEAINPTVWIPLTSRTTTGTELVIIPATRVTLRTVVSGGGASVSVDSRIW